MCQLDAWIRDATIQEGKWMGAKGEEEMEDNVTSEACKPPTKGGLGCAKQRLNQNLPTKILSFHDLTSCFWHSFKWLFERLG